MPRSGSCLGIGEDECNPDQHSGSVKSHHFRTSSAINGCSSKSFLYSTLPREPLRLSVLKMDGSSFDIHVMGTATVRELKEAIESAFCHVPDTGSGKISWSHVWGHFCLCYNSQKLLMETDPISIYGIDDGDQLHIVRHVSSTCAMEEKRLSKRLSTSKLCRKSLLRLSSDAEVEVDGGGGDGDGDSSGGEILAGFWELGFLQFLRGCHSMYSQLPTEEGMSLEESHSPQDVAEPPGTYF
ncbi:hypothetical protein SAY86_030375 [Trapa natans]|uniref:SNRNP25 ubiquitin-like domain-containing protein n=1 Tax=Trapa natans TaxID=22666 RepID=A0AAN7RAJ2_TRANT|nr:hypothetical protein SAY86_030375 [Trapa natans]